MKSKRIPVALCGLFATIVVGVVLTIHFMGISVYVITGGSMAGAIPKGSVAIDRSVPVNTLQVGDIITFQPPSGGGNVTHRIIEIDRDANGDPVFRTKGDFNEAADPWQFTLDRPVQARYFFHVAWVGYFLAVFTLRAVRTTVLAVVALMILGATISWFRRTRTDDEGGPLRKSMTLYRAGGSQQ